MNPLFDVSISAFVVLAIAVMIVLVEPHVVERCTMPKTMEVDMPCEAPLEVYDKIRQQEEESDMHMLLWISDCTFKTNVFARYICDEYRPLDSIELRQALYRHQMSFIVEDDNNTICRRYEQWISNPMSTVLWFSCCSMLAAANPLCIPQQPPRQHC